MSSFGQRKTQARHPAKLMVDKRADDPFATRRNAPFAFVLQPFLTLPLWRGPRDRRTLGRFLHSNAWDVGVLGCDSGIGQRVRAIKNLSEAVAKNDRCLADADEFDRRHSSRAWDRLYDGRLVAFQRPINRTGAPGGGRSLRLKCGERNVGGVG